MTWLEASNQYSLDEFIDTFFYTRERTQELLDGLKRLSSCVRFRCPSLLVDQRVDYTFGLFARLLSQHPAGYRHQPVAARRRSRARTGEGAKQNMPAEQLHKNLQFATEQIHTAIEGTRGNHDPEKAVTNSIFGVCTYKTWVLLLLAHEVDHLRYITDAQRSTDERVGYAFSMTVKLLNLNAKSAKRVNFWFLLHLRNSH